MNPPYAVAGRDIEPGMTVILAPGDDAFVVAKVEETEHAPSWVRVYNEEFFPCLAQKNAWYAEVEQ